MTARQSRRAFIAGGATAVTTVAATAASASGDTGLKIADVSEVKPGSPVDFSYPEDALAYLVDMGRAVPGGQGPNNSLVAFSGLCQHRGCPIDYNGDKELFVCPCHRSVFDPASDGAVVEGPSQRGLPRVTIEIRDGAVYATGIENGPVYGRACSNA
jgi:arsenite oxidase small subunit